MSHFQELPALRTITVLPTACSRRWPLFFLLFSSFFFLGVIPVVDSAQHGRGPYMHHAGGSWRHCLENRPDTTFHDLVGEIDRRRCMFFFSWALCRYRVLLTYGCINRLKYKHSRREKRKHASVPQGMLHIA